MTTISIHERRRIEAIRLHQQQARILRDTIHTAPIERTGYQDPADERQLRGIPAIGRGVSGHIAETHPEKATIEKLMREPREGYHHRGTRWIS